MDIQFDLCAHEFLNLAESAMLSPAYEKLFWLLTFLFSFPGWQSIRAIFNIMISTDILFKKILIWENKKTSEEMKNNPTS